MDNNQRTTINEQRTDARGIIDYYAGYDESQRLTDGFGKLERLRTQQLIARHLPSKRGTIADVGGGNGVYAFWIAEQGHAVHLIDIVPKHIDDANEIARRSGINLASIAVGDARKLELADGTADVVILHGPLYHLIDRDERLKTLQEAKRILRPQGTLLAFAINRYAGLIYGLNKGMVFEKAYLDMLRQEIATGQRRSPDWAKTFNQAYFHLPHELEAEIKEAGFSVQATLGVIGPAWQVPDLNAAWEDEEKRKTILEISQLTENEPILGPRLLCVGIKE